tara:strand:+ start:222 stop:506 length:285 start_codon:yes stop_codon:yes gene_type:complete
VLCFSLLVTRVTKQQTTQTKKGINMIFVCEARYSIKDEKKPDDENYDSFGRVIEKTSAKGFFEATDYFEASLEVMLGNLPRLRDYDIIKVALDE